MKKQFIEMFSEAENHNSDFIFVEIIAAGIKEVIVLPKESFNAKREFYKNAYNDDLLHVMNDKVEIVRFAHGSLTDLKYHF